jgi:ferric-dicitrate binding protein FerR (iron transport regulator)
VNKQADEEFKFTTPTAVASIRGTEGLFEVADNGESVMVLKTGSVELQTKTGKKVTLTAGNTAVFDLEGNATVTPSTEDDKKKLSQATSLTTKKVIIKTSTGEEITVEYFSGENK